MEELECLSAAVDLKDDIRELVENFLDCLGKQYQILLLRIDDIDLNAKEAGVMAELVRKYFIIPNVMVLMALKMDQLETIKSNEFSDSFNLEKIVLMFGDVRALPYQAVSSQSTCLYARHRRLIEPKVDTEVR